MHAADCLVLQLVSSVPARTGSAALGLSSGQSGSDHMGGCVTLMGGFDLEKTVTKLDVGQCLRHGLRIYGSCQDIGRFGLRDVRVAICPHFWEEFLERVTQALTSLIT